MIGFATDISLQSFPGLCLASGEDHALGELQNRDRIPEQPYRQTVHLRVLQLLRLMFLHRFC